MSPDHPIQHLTLEDVLQLHVEIMERTGAELQPPRTLNGLASAIHRTQTSGYYGGIDPVGQAARLATGISRAQAFLDGNKRTALAAATAFLRLNGLAFVGDWLELARQLEELADPAVSDDDADDRLESWLRGHVIPTRPR